MQAGRRGDKRGRWALEELLEVRRVRGRGRGLEVHVRWSGGDAAGRPWDDSWVGVTWLTPDQRREARGIEVELYKANAPAGQPTRPAASRPRRTSAVYKMPFSSDLTYDANIKGTGSSHRANLFATPRDPTCACT